MEFAVTRHLPTILLALLLIAWASLIGAERTSDWAPRTRLMVYTLAVGITTLGVFLFAVIDPRAELLGRVFWHGPAGDHQVALTFDDGPNPPYTQQVLDILSRNRIHATFFLIGANVETYPALARRILREGHAVGTHTYDHPDYMALRDTPKQISDQIVRGIASLEQATGERPYLFRPPLGFRNPFYFTVAKREHLIVVEWSVRAFDTKHPPADIIVRRILQGTRDGAIILMHDGDETVHGGDRSQTVAALQPLIDSLRTRGYRFVTVPEMLGLE
jgi:peptidoglycan/xylan/chitin deacetylase (PgdA/CDA1 family)